jgi:hypothetical protein
LFTALPPYRLTAALQPYEESLHQTSHNMKRKVPMVLMASKLITRVYQMFNDNAESVGEIRQPLQPAMLGFGRGTVYLDRPMPAVKADDRVA